MKRYASMAAVATAVALALSSSGAEAAGKRRSIPKPLSGVVNLNTATASQLDLLPGVGLKAAERIIAHRAKTPFTRPEELVKVKGFGKKKFDKLKPHLAVAGPTTLRLLKSDEAAAAQGRAAPSR